MLKLTVLIYNLLFPFLFLLYSPFYLVKLFRRGNFLRGFGERFGCFSRERRRQLAGLSRPVWIHAVSVGETVAALSFIRRWQDRDPDLQIVLSTTTSTGQQIARDKAPPNVVTIYCPIDFYPFVRGTLKAVNPSLVVIFEVEIWPNIILAARAWGLPVALVNGRLSDRSARGYYRFRAFFGPLLGQLGLIAVQSEADVERVRRLVGDTTSVVNCNTMKFDQIPDRQAGDVHGIINQVFPEDAMIFTAASTHSGEEALMARAYREVHEAVPELRMIVVPRHVERTAEVEADLAAAELQFLKLTDLRGGNAARPADVLIVDTTGEMMDFLAQSDIVFVGKSLAGQHGGHNIIEPAIFGKPILFGRNMENFRRVAEIFRQREAAVEVPDDDAFVQALKRLATDPEERRRLQEAARRTVEEQRGAIDRTIDLLSEMLGDQGA